MNLDVPWHLQALGDPNNELLDIFRLKNIEICWPETELGQSSQEYQHLA